MYERLIESWLDSASERSYQPCFCQMLNAKGYEILHSTRHSPMEFGKDIIARGPDNVICAFQLKGNPGKRLTLAQLREIQAQLIQLVSQPVKISGLQQAAHRSYLVTNGEIDEEARLALNEIGDGLKLTGYAYPEIVPITRGTMFTWANALGARLWPSELTNISQFIEILIEDGRKFPSLMKFHSLLSNTLGLNSNRKKHLSASEVKRRINSSALLIGIALNKYNESKNHYASIIAWTMFSVYVIGACEKYNVSYRVNGKKSVELAKTAIFDSLYELLMEIKERGHIVEGDPLIDTPFYLSRQLLLSALLSLLWFWAEEQGWRSNSHKDFVASFIPGIIQRGWLWGEGAVPQLLIFLWYKRKTDSTMEPDMQLANLTKSACFLNLKEGSNSLASPYFTFEDVVRHELRMILGEENDPLLDENPINSSFVAEGLFHLLVRTGLKINCKLIWPDYSRLNLHKFVPKKIWQYCLWRSEEGIEKCRQSPVRETWDNIVEEAREARGENIPLPLRNDKFLLMLWIIIAPHRASPETIRHLGQQFNECWFIPPAYI